MFKEIFKLSNFKFIVAKIKLYEGVKGKSIITNFKLSFFLILEYFLFI